MCYKCYRCHKELKEGQTKCDKCGAIKIDVPKKEDIEKNKKVAEENYIDLSSSKYAPYLIALSIILNIFFLILAGINYESINLLLLFTGLALVSILFGYIFFENNKWIRLIATIEAFTIYLALFLGFLLLKRLVKKLTGKDIEWRFRI